MKRPIAAATAASASVGRIRVAASSGVVGRRRVGVGRRGARRLGRRRQPVRSGSGRKRGHRRRIDGHERGARALHATEVVSIFVPATASERRERGGDHRDDRESTNDHRRGNANAHTDRLPSIGETGNVHLRPGCAYERAHRCAPMRVVRRKALTSPPEPASDGAYGSDKAHLLACLCRDTAGDGVARSFGALSLLVRTLTRDAGRRTTTSYETMLSTSGLLDR